MLEAITAPDVVMRLIGGFADMMGSEFRGRDAALTWFAEWFSAFDARTENEVTREADERVVAIFNVVASGAASGASAAIRTDWVISFRAGQVSAVDAYYTADAALKAVGRTGMGRERRSGRRSAAREHRPVAGA